MPFFNNLFGKKDPSHSTVSESAVEIKPKIDRQGQAEMLFNTAMEIFHEADNTQDGERKREALIMLSNCVDQFPEFVKAHCVLTRAMLYLNETDQAIGVAAKAYQTDPENEEVCGAYASCFVKKGSDLWEQGDLEEALNSFINALKVNGFEMHAFASSRHLARETNQLERWAGECVALGIDPLKDVDISQLRSS